MHTPTTLPLKERPRRLRRTATLRRMVRETRLSVDQLIAPLFVVEGKHVRQEIAAMPGQYRLSIDELIKEAQQLYALGIPAVALFPALDASLKTPDGREALNPKGLYPRAIQALKQALPELLVITDVALDPYSSDGHDGIVRQGRIVNDETVEILARMAVVQAQAGADIVAPSDMMDGRVGAIRKALDEEGFTEVAILSYTAKYASAFYGPFREALDSAPRHRPGIPPDKKTYQMDPANAREALRELRLDLDEGADIVMVKPALPYLDVIYRLRQACDVPVAAYHVSGEYAMLKAAAQNGWIDEKAAVFEVLTAIHRAGADLILTYFAGQLAQWLKQDLH
ncbi:porphobilinogen synthase [Rhodothermus bifroesti]|uniref:Delta-aminolevulinic acid dehydratase n=1 Tax=Rhodothermus marinus TaxID=29549 RepID=A0A7V2B0H2_RHOMR|nr:porphobilinogen synthase [Rhodothermus bifroesti]GBD01335.1 Delta-aminolevulinic acid dehydratase [bacterium HR18]